MVKTVNEILHDTIVIGRPVTARLVSKSTGIIIEYAGEGWKKAFSHHFGNYIVEKKMVNIESDKVIIVMWTNEEL